MHKMNAWLALFFFTWRQTLRDRKFWLMLVLLLMPSALVGVVRYFGPVLELSAAWHLYHGLMQFMLLLCAVPLACMVSGAGLIGAEVESRTITFLTTRSLKRKWMLVARFSAFAMILMIAGCIGVIALHMVVMSSQSWAHSLFRAEDDWNAGRDLVVYLQSVCLAAVTFLAVFTMISLVAAKPLALSLIYYVLIELIAGNVPAAVSGLSISRHLRDWGVSRAPSLAQINPQIMTSDSWGALKVALIGVAALLLACYAVGRRELVPHKVARD